MNTPTPEKIEAARHYLRAFGEKYDYDTTYLEVFMDASPLAFQAFEAAMPMARVQNAAPVDLIFIVKIATMQAEDCGPCLRLSIKMAREAGVAESVIHSVLQGGRDLSPIQYDVYRYTKAVARNEQIDPELIAHLEETLGRAALAEFAVNIVAARMYPTVKRALGYAKSCSLMPSLLE